ncbi:ParB/RepB/Spo0J family partition protein [Pseudomonas sp. JG-B]|uniref:ParB/RepB/Spo0J family partition protein n=1 Tax=Pseudomonas sp. JG-B TaxID=2603214 RepID=UPI00129D524F|nr:ParB/RepB/Spo0J family partition protein [Pseudomonas sp. JG-B]MRK19114.1 ParB/RepB/Spo0J family partition protein [Pseudomonas sp. JG-B]
MMNAEALSDLTADHGQNYSSIAIAEITIKKQVREVFEDDENTLEDLAASIKAQGVLQPILIRPLPEGGYELVAGERRIRASLLAGLDRVPAIIREMTDEEAHDAQIAENIQRKNLTQIETAKALQEDIDKLGSVEAVMAKRQKSRAWISKWLQLLELPEQAQRLLSENVSADLEVIAAVRQVEKVDPEKAKELVDELKDTRGKKGNNARDTANARQGCRQGSRAEG